MLIKTGYPNLLHGCDFVLTCWILKEFEKYISNMIQICGINIILLREKLTEYFLSYMAFID